MNLILFLIHTILEEVESGLHSVHVFTNDDHFLKMSKRGCILSSSLSLSLELIDSVLHGIIIDSSVVVVVILEVLEDLLNKLVHLADKSFLSLGLVLLQVHAHLLDILLYHSSECLLIQSSLVSELQQATYHVTMLHILVVLNYIEDLLRLVLSIFLGDHLRLDRVPSQSLRSLQ